MNGISREETASNASQSAHVASATETVGGAPSAAHPAYVTEALKGLTRTQKKYVIDGCLHGDVTTATIRALRDRALFFLHIDSPNGRCGSMRLTPLGVTVQRILKERAIVAAEGRS